MRPPDPAPLARALSLVVAVGIAWLSLTPSNGDPDAGWGFLKPYSELVFGTPDQTDKIAHAIAYTTLAGFLALGFLGRRSLPLLFASAVVYGMFFELAHAVLPTREASFGDVLANTAGAALGSAGGLFAHQLWKWIR